MRESNNLPHIDKLVGLPQEVEHHRQGWEEHAHNLVREETEHFMEGYELDKTPRDLEIIEFVARSVDQYFSKLNREKIIEFTEANIHILREGGTEAYLKGVRDISGGAHSTVRNSILVDRTSSDIQFALILAHELFHLKAYKALQVIPGNEQKDAQLKSYRNGITVTSRDGEFAYLKDFEEAIISILNENFFKEYITGSELFAKELQEMERNQVTLEKERIKEREALNKLIDDLWEANPLNYPSRDTIVDLFVDAHVNGNLIKVAKLIELVYGKGSFRRVAQETGERKS